MEAECIDSRIVRWMNGGRDGCVGGGLEGGKEDRSRQE